MQITLNQEEIHAAVEGFVRSQITIAKNQTITIDFTAGRGANGLSATLDIKPASSRPSALRSVPDAPVAEETPVACEAPVMGDPDEAEEVTDPEADAIEEEDEVMEAPAVSRSSIFGS